VNCIVAYIEHWNQWYKPWSLQLNICFRTIAPSLTEPEGERVRTFLEGEYGPLASSLQLYLSKLYNHIIN